MTELHEKINKLQSNTEMTELHEKINKLQNNADEWKETLLQAITHLNYSLSSKEHNSSLSSKELRELMDKG